MRSKRFRYEYVQLVRVIDGDTVVVDIDLGMGVWVRGETLRLYGLNAPEMNTERGRTAKTFLEQLLDGAKLEIETFRNLRTAVDKREKYGRYVALLLISRNAGEIVNANEVLLKAGHAVPYMETESV